MNRVKFTRIFGLLLVLAVASCSGGGGGAGVASTGVGGGIGGTGYTASGTIDAFGSIFVNGIEFETDAAAITLDGEPADASQLGLGMVVLVSGTLNEDGVTGTANSVIYDDEAQGPITAIDVSGDGDSKLITVLNLVIRVDRIATVFEGFTFDTLALGDLVEVTGFFDANGELRATRLEKKEAFVEGESEVELKGVVENLTGQEFSLGGFTVDYTSADLSGIPAGTLNQGMFVEVKGTLVGTLVTAVEIEEEDELSDSLEPDDEIGIEGSISQYVSDADFRVGTTPVDASNASFSPEDAVLTDGLFVEVEGKWNGSTLVAEEVELRSDGAEGETSGEVSIRASVASVSTATRLISLQLFNGTVVVTVDSRTQMEDKTEIADPLTLADINPGDFLLMQGRVNGDDILIDQLDRDEIDDDRLEGPLDSFKDSDSITVLGITYSTAGASFEDADDRSISESEFYQALEPGKTVKIVDERVPDGIADEVELED